MAAAAVTGGWGAGSVAVVAVVKRLGGRWGGGHREAIGEWTVIPSPKGGQHYRQEHAQP